MGSFMMDKITEYVKNLKFKTTVIGFDKEQVFVSIKELLDILDETVNVYSQENKLLKEKILEMNKDIDVQKNTNNEIFNEVTKLRKYSAVYHDLEDEYIKLQKDSKMKDALLTRIKEETQKNIDELNNRYNDLLVKYNSVSQSSMYGVKDIFQKALDDITDEFIEKTNQLSDENKELKEENEKLKKRIEELLEEDYFIKDVNKKFQSIDKYKKEE